MSWLYSILFAGLVFASDGDLPKHSNYISAEPEAVTIVKSDETERFEQTYPLSPNGRVSVSNVNGSISVETWNRNEVKLEWIKNGDSKESLGEVEIKIDARQDSFSVQTNYLDWKRPGASGRTYNRLTVEYRLIVPQNAVLDEIETVNGTVSIKNASNVTKASAVNGEIRATNLRGAATLSTVNGTVEADFDQMQTGSRISLETVNGTVNLTIPSDANATVKADTVNGKISNDFGLPVRKGQYVGRDMYGKIGSGDVQIKLESVNGELSVKRKNDGKTLNPATNLLPAKNKGDEDWDDDDNDFSAAIPPTPPTPRIPKTPRTPRTPPTSPMPPTPPGFDGEFIDAETRKQIEQAMKDAEKEMRNMSLEDRKELEAELKRSGANLNSKEMQDRLKAAQDQYREAMVLMADANWMNGSPLIEEKSDSFTVKGTPKVTVEAGDCAVSVRGWDKPEVQYTLTKLSRSRGQTPLDFKAEQNGSDVNIKIGGGGNGAGGRYFSESNRMRLEIFVPKKSNLKITTGGEIRLEGVSGKIDLKGDDEAINVRDGDGQMTVNSNDARIRIIGFSGEVDAKNVDGTMNFEGDFQKLSAQTADGIIILTLPENADANIESSGENTIGEGFTPNYADDGKSVSVWKIGKGGNSHRLLTTADGRIIVRNANTLKSVQ
jgi:DUF4097 and DUF4098 domain-containing protein YvlB/uncharacterized membrane protein